MLKSCGDARADLAAFEGFSVPQNRPGTDIGTCLESPLMAEAVEEVGADKFCATIVLVG